MARNHDTQTLQSAYASGFKRAEDEYARLAPWLDSTRTGRIIGGITRPVTDGSRLPAKGFTTNYLAKAVGELNPLQRAAATKLVGNIKSQYAAMAPEAQSRMDSTLQEHFSRLYGKPRSARGIAAGLDGTFRNRFPEYAKYYDLRGGGRRSPLGSLVDDSKTWFLPRSLLPVAPQIAGNRPGRPQ